MVLIVDELLVQVGDESHQCKTHSRQCPHQLTAIPGGGKGPSGVVGANEDEDEAEQKEHREDVRGERGNSGTAKKKAGKNTKKAGTQAKAGMSAEKSTKKAGKREKKKVRCILRNVD